MLVFIVRYKIRIKKIILYLGHKTKSTLAKTLRKSNFKAHDLMAYKDAAMMATKNTTHSIRYPPIFIETPHSKSRGRSSTSGHECVVENREQKH